MAATRVTPEGGLSRARLSRAGSVSYTHLDVYKRQALCAESLLGCPGEPGPLTLVFRREVRGTGEVVRPYYLIGSTCFPGTRLGRPLLTLAHIREALATVPWAKLNTGMQPPNNLTPVSYTHLDVYKRQVYAFLLFFSFGIRA